MQGGTIKGPLDCSNCTLSTTLNARSTNFSDGLDFTHANVRLMMLEGCTIGSFSLFGANVQGSIFLTESTIGFLNAASAFIDGNVFASGNTFGGPETEVACIFNQAEFHILDVRGSRFMGGLSITAAKAKTMLGADNIEVTVPDEKYAVAAPGFQAKAISMQGAKIRGCVSFYTLNLENDIYLHNSEFRSSAVDLYTMDLSGATVRNMHMNGVTVEGDVDVRRSQIRGTFSAADAKLNYPTGSALNLSESQIGVINLDRAVVAGFVNANRTIVHGPLSAEGARISYEEGCALSGTEARVQSVLLDGIELKGACYFDQGEIGGSFKASNAKITAKGNWYALSLRQTKVQHLVADDSQFNGGASIGATHIPDGFSASRTSFIGQDGSAIQADRCSIGWVELIECTLGGDCYFYSSAIEGSFYIEKTAITASTALSLYSARIGAVHIRQSKINGHCSLTYSAIKHYLGIEGSDIASEKNAAVDLAGASIAQCAIAGWEDGGKTTKSQLIGGLVASRAKIAHDLIIEDATIRAQNSVAVAARGIQIGSGLRVRRSTLDGAFVVTTAVIEGKMDFVQSSLSSASAARSRTVDPLPKEDESTQESKDNALYRNLAIDLGESLIHRLEMPEQAEFRPQGSVNLSRAKIGTFCDYAATWPDPNNSTGHILELDGFEYEHLTNPNGVKDDQAANRGIADARLQWLRAQSPDALYRNFRPQPWQQLAKVLATQGYEDDARKIAIERRVALRYAQGTPRFQRAISRALHVLADYGFNPWKSVWWSLGIVAVFAMIYYAAALTCTSRIPLCADQAAFVRVVAADFVPAIQDEAEAAKTLERVYPAFDPVLYSLDAFLPLFNLGTEPYWRPNENLRVEIAGVSVPAGRVLQWLYVIEQILGAVLASLIVTGFTGLLTSDER